jgi:hypothetical protein
MRRRLLSLFGLFIVLLAMEPSAFGQAPTMDQVAVVQARHESTLMALPGVIGVGIGIGTAGQLVLQVYVDQDAQMPALPAALDGVPVTSLQIEKPVTHIGGSGCVPCHSSQLPLPTQMGHSTSNNAGACYSCTIGFKVCDTSTGTLGFVTNNHCNPAANGCENGPIGATFFERSLGDNGCSGVGLQNCGTSNKVAALGLSGNKVDAAFVASNAAQSKKKVEDVGGARSAPATVSPGTCIRKSGRTSGLTYGRVSSVNTTINVGGYCQGTLQFIQQIVYLADTSCGQCTHPPCPISLPGDSGSPVLLANKRKIVGLNFAGGNGGQLGIGNTVANVLSELGGLTLKLKQCPAVTA